MSLPPNPIEPVPEETTQIARAAFPKGNIYMKMRDELGTIYDNPKTNPISKSTCPGRD